MMGYEPKAIPTPFPTTNVPTAQEQITILQRARDKALAAHELAHQTMMERITRGFTPFELGQRVWLDAKNLKMGHPTQKLTLKREGPFTISEEISNLSYQLQLPVQWRIHPVFHASLLTPYKKNDIHGTNFLEPPPDLIEGEPKYEVEAIVAHQCSR